jgi:branched-chain amino acid transport system substrate-binding protein
MGLAKSSIDDLPAFRKALLTSEIPSVRGSFKFGPNQHPVQDWYSLKAEKGANGKMVLKTNSKVLSAHSASYAVECKMPAD